jgi:hypothetical protein
MAVWLRHRGLRAAASPSTFLCFPMLVASSLTELDVKAVGVIPAAFKGLEWLEAAPNGQRTAFSENDAAESSSHLNPRVGACFLLLGDPMHRPRVSANRYSPSARSTSTKPALIAC